MKKDEKIHINNERRQVEQKQKSKVTHLRGISKTEKLKQLKKKAINIKRDNIELRSTGDDLYYSTENQSYSDLGSGNYEFSFDIFGTAVNCCHHFGQSSIFLNYNTEAFGDNIDLDDRVTTIKASDFTSSKYQILQGDFDDNILLVSVWNSDDKFLGKEFPANEKLHLFTIKIGFKEAGCNVTPNLTIDTNTYKKYFTYYDSSLVSQHHNFDTIYVDPISSNPELCPHPIITTKFSTLGAFHAGTNEILQIRGRGFGNTNGAIYFKDSNVGSNTYTNSVENKYIQPGWSDTLIQVEIPSLIKNNYTNNTYGCAGSGLVKIKTDEGEAVSKDSIYIEYAHTNKNASSSPNSSHEKIWLAKLYCINGFYFTCDTSLQSRPDMVTAIQYCLKQWVDSTGLQLGLEKDVIGNVVFLPKSIGGYDRNFIYIDPSLASSTIMLTPIVPIKPSSSNDYYVRFNTSIIAINPNFSYYFTPTGSKPSGYIDFIHTFLHEIGHILCMDHRLCYQDNLKGLLYYTATDNAISSYDRANLTQWASQDMKAVKYILDQSKQLSSFDIYPYVKPLSSFNLALSATPTISPSNDTNLCADKTPYTYTLTSSVSSSNFWSTLETTQSIIPQAPSFLGGNTEREIYYSVRRYNDNCTESSLPSKPIKILWKKNCPKGGEDHLVSGGQNELSSMDGEFEYYPNPTNDIINLSVKSYQGQDVDVKIMDIRGNLILSKKQQLVEGENRFALQLNMLNSGIYIVQLNNGVDTFSNTFVKSK